MVYCMNVKMRLIHCDTAPPILAIPDFHRELILDTDASDSVLGAVLSQIHDDGKAGVCPKQKETIVSLIKNY